MGAKSIVCIWLCLQQLRVARKIFGTRVATLTILGELDLPVFREESFEKKYSTIFTCVVSVWWNIDWRHQADNRLIICVWNLHPSCSITLQNVRELLHTVRWSTSNTVRNTDVRDKAGVGMGWLLCVSVCVCACVCVWTKDLTIVDWLSDRQK